MNDEVELGTEKIDAILDTIKVLGVTGKKVLADGKVNIADLPHAIALLSQVSVMVDSVKGAKGALKQAKDLKEDEVVAIIQKIYDVVEAIESADE